MSLYEEAVQAEMARQQALYETALRLAREGAEQSIAREEAAGKSISEAGRRERLEIAQAMVERPEAEWLIRRRLAHLEETAAPDPIEYAQAPDFSRLVYRIGDRFWDVAEAQFIPRPEDASRIVIPGGEATEENLRKTLEFYGLEVGDELKSLEEIREDRLAALGEAFAKAQAEGVIMSAACGFEIDATERANRDIEGLITALEAKGEASATFCAADNSFHEVTLAQLKAMRLEIIARGQELYARKWQIRAAIEAATHVSQLPEIEAL